MHAELQALKEAFESGDADCQSKLDSLIAKTSNAQNIARTNQVQSFLEEGEDHINARAQYQQRVKLLENTGLLQGNQLILDD